MPPVRRLQHSNNSNLAQQEAVAIREEQEVIVLDDTEEEEEEEEEENGVSHRGPYTVSLLNYDDIDNYDVYSKDNINRVARIQLEMHRITVPEQRELCDWIKAEYASGRDVYARHIIEYATELMEKRGDFEGEPLDDEWLKEFCGRYSIDFDKLNKKPNSRLDCGPRYKGVDRAFQLFHELVERLNIKKENIYSMDQTFFKMLDRALNYEVRADLDAQKERLLPEIFTTTEIISATGKYLLPLLTLKTDGLDDKWFDRDSKNIPNFCYGINQNGRPCEKQVMHYFENIFINETQPSDPNEWRLVVLTDRENYVTDEFIVKAKEHKVWPLYVYRSTSNFTQPLDIVASPLKRSFELVCNRIREATGDDILNRYAVIHAYDICRKEVLQEDHIVKAWERSGFVPFKPQVVLERYRTRREPLYSNRSAC